MLSGRWCRLTTTSSTPWARSHARTCSTSVRDPRGTMALATSRVKGSRRVPRPAQSTSADSTAGLSHWRVEEHCARVAASRARAPVPPERGVGLQPVVALGSSQGRRGARDRCRVALDLDEDAHRRLVDHDVRRIEAVLFPPLLAAKRRLKSKSAHDAFEDAGVGDQGFQLLAALDRSRLNRSLEGQKGTGAVAPDTETRTRATQLRIGRIEELVVEETGRN